MFLASECRTDTIISHIMVLSVNAKFIPAQTPGVHSSDILCYCSFNDSFIPSNICILKCGVSSRQHNSALLNYLFLSQHNKVEHSQTEDGL